MGGIAITAVGTLIRDVVHERRERRKRRAEKFEELVAAVYDFDHWVDNLRLSTAYGDEKNSSAVSPFYKLQAISSVYFPQFDTKIDELDKATAGYRVWMIGAGQKRLANQIDSMSMGFVEAYEPYSEKRDGLLKALKEFAHREFQ